MNTIMFRKLINYISFCCLYFIYAINYLIVIYFFVPGALITAGVLTAGLISFRQGNSHLGQMLMRARVVAQGGTVALMVGSAYYYGEHFTGAKNQEK